MTADTASNWARTLAVSDDLAARREAARQLSLHPEEAQVAAIALVTAASDADESLREWAVSTLEDLGPPSAADLSELLRLADNSSSDIAWWAITLLGRLGPEASDAAALLARRSLDETSPAVRQRAIWALGQLGPAATGQRDTLVTLADSEDAQVARLARQALERVPA